MILLDVANVHDHTNVAVTSVAQHGQSIAVKYVLTSHTALFHVIGDHGFVYTHVVVPNVGATLLNVYTAALDA